MLFTEKFHLEFGAYEILPGPLVGCGGGILIIHLIMVSGTHIQKKPKLQLPSKVTISSSQQSASKFRCEGIRSIEGTICGIQRYSQHQIDFSSPTDQY